MSEVSASGPPSPARDRGNSVKKLFVRIPENGLSEIQCHARDTEKYHVYYTTLPGVLLKIQKGENPSRVYGVFIGTESTLTKNLHEIIALCCIAFLNDPKDVSPEEFAEVLRRARAIDPRKKVSEYTKEELETLKMVGTLTGRLGIRKSKRIPRKRTIYLRIPSEIPEDTEIIEVRSVSDILEARERMRNG